MTSREASGVPLSLSSKQQSLMAELCRVMSDYLHCGEKGRDDEAMDATLVEEITDALDRFECTSQVLATLYDKFHRTGSNHRLVPEVFYKR